MLIPEFLVWKMTDRGGCSAIKVFCPEAIREEVTSEFAKVFEEEYEKLADQIEAEEGSCYEKEEGVSASMFYDAEIKEYGVLLRFESFEMRVNEDNLSLHDVDEVLDKALKHIKDKYPASSYEGYIAYHRSDTHGGDVVQYAVSSEDKKNGDDTVYDFVGTEVAFMDDDVWDEYIEELEYADEDDIKDAVGFFHMYSDWVPADLIGRVIETAAEDDDETRESLETYLQTLKAGKK